MQSKCIHNAWNGYGLMTLINRYGYIKNDNPKIFKIYNEKGEWHAEVSEKSCQYEINEAHKKGQKLMVELQDNSELLVKLEANIKRVKEQIKEHRENCVG